jgi:hypothetical protein
MRERTLTLALHGDVSLGAFADAIGHWRGLIDALTRQVAAQRDVRWVIADLAAGSATATVIAIGDVDAAASVEDAYVEIGQALVTGSLVRFPRAIQTDAFALLRLIEHDVDYLRFETPSSDVIITTNWDPLLERADRLLPPAAPAAYGGVQGRIQTLTSRHGLRFTLYDTLHDRAVACYLSEGQEDIMRDAWGQTAVVEGVVARDPMTGRPLNIRRVRNVTTVRSVASDAYLAARGAIVRATNDRREPEELISAARDA